MSQDKIDIGLAKLTQEGNHADCWVVYWFEGEASGREDVTASEAADLVEDAGTYSTWATTASGILGMWSGLSTGARHALHANCDGPQPAVVTFRDAVLHGTATVDDVSTWVAAHHLGDPCGVDLRVRLGLTIAEYRRWEGDPAALAAILGADETTV